MPSVEWSAPETDAPVASEFFRSWHGSLPETAGGGCRWTSIMQLPMARTNSGSLSDIISALEAEGSGLGALVHPVDGHGGDQNLYHHVGVTKTRANPKSRGTKLDTDMIPGAWADLDIKDGGFTSWDHIYGVLNKMDRHGVGPQIIVMTGSGGAHFYWRVEGGQDPNAAVLLSKRMKRWIEAEYSVKLDNVAQANRIMRLPGSVRFPKRGETLKPILVSMPRNEDMFADLAVITRVTQGAWDAWEARNAPERERLTEDFYATISSAAAELEFQGVLHRSDGVDLVDFFASRRFTEEGMDSEWDQMWGKFAFIDKFNNSVSWAAILEPHGWTKYGDQDEEGHQSWTRPGGGAKNPRSAVTDWHGGPHVMSLLSDAPETGLSHLYAIADDATRKTHKLHKARVAAELRFGGSMEKLIGAWLASHRGAGW